MRIVFTLLGLFICTAGYSQSREGEFYIFNQDWSTAKDLNSAAYFMHLVKENDTTYVCRYYNKTGPLVKWETYYDQDLSIPNGRFAWYNAKGMLDSMGFTYRGKKDRTWEYLYDDSSRAIIKKKYNKGKFLWQENHLSKTVQYANGSIRQLNEKGFVTSDSLTTDTTDTIQPAEYKGGLNAWMQYLSRELTPPDLKITELFQDNQAQMILGFTVSEEGKISDIFIFQSAIWSFDMECIRVIRKGGDWIPAKKNGMPVEFNHKQSFTFRGIRN
jgi:hypothetical protein